jgi:hypothetical protein
LCGGEFAEVINALHPFEIWGGVLLKGFYAKGAAQFHHALTLFDARKTAAILHVFAAHGAGRNFVAIADGILKAHKGFWPNRMHSSQRIEVNLPLKMAQHALAKVGHFLSEKISRMADSALAIPLHLHNDFSRPEQFT